MNKPHFIVKKNLQKSTVTGVLFSDVVTPDILADVCFRITGETSFTYDYVDNDYCDDFVEATYNKGRMAIMLYQDVAHYITFSEKSIGGRNSSVQSVPTAFNMFFSNAYPKKKLYYYFLKFEGNAETDYQMLIYRLMATVGFQFLNAETALSSSITPFASIEDIMFNRRINSGRNRSNNSSYITKSDRGQIEIYGKTYGANKYETSLMCYAVANLWREEQTIKLFEVLEGDLKELPASSLSVIKQMGIISVVPIDMTLEKTIFEKQNSLRSPRYTFNLLERLGNKHCALCGCEIPELIQGAHIWPVADIKRERTMSFEDKLRCAIDGENGLWLCENHHKMFDEHMITFGNNGQLLIQNGLERRHLRFIDEITPNKQLPEFILTERFLEYLWRRMQSA